MPITPIDLREKAKSLASSSEEFDLRTSIRTAYYSAYHQVCPCLMYLASSTYIKHSEVGEILADIRNMRNIKLPRLAMALGAEAELASKQYIACKEERVRADYRLDGHVFTADAEAQVRRVSAIFKFSVRLQTELSRSIP